MRKFRFVIIGFWAAFTLVSCSEDIRIPGFEAQKWKEDPNGCHGEREKLLAALLKGRTELIGKNEMEIKTLLGKPDSKDIRTRGQIFFEYGVVGGNLCDPSTITQPEILRIRFDALDRVTEVAVY